MSLKPKIDTKQSYELTLIDVKAIYRVNYKVQGMQFLFRIDELGIETCRTFTLPKSLQKPDNLFTKFISPVMFSTLSDDLLYKPRLLANKIKNEIGDRQLTAKIDISDSGNHINVLGIFLH